MKLVTEIFKGIVDKTSEAVLPIIKCENKNISKLNYQHGHYAEIHQTLVQMNNGKRYKEIYPLVALLEDLPYNDTTGTGTLEPRFTIVICYYSEIDYKSSDRVEKVIKPVLVPIYKELKKQILLSGEFSNYTIPHTMTVRPYYGTPENAAGGTKKNRANIFSDILDSIEMSNIQLKLYNEC